TISTPTCSATRCASVSLQLRTFFFPFTRISDSSEDLTLISPCPPRIVIRAFASTTAGATSRSLVVILPQSRVQSCHCLLIRSVATTPPISARSPSTRNTSPGVMLEPPPEPDRDPTVRSYSFTAPQKISSNGHQCTNTRLNS